MATPIPPTTSTEPFPTLEVTPDAPVSLSSTLPNSLPTINEVTEAPPARSVQLPSLRAVDISPKSDRHRFSPAPLPPTLTGAGALADAKRKRQQESDTSRQTTPNPSLGVMQALKGDSGISRPSDAHANAPPSLSEPLRKVAEKLVIPENNNVAADSLQTSPVSISSFGTADGTIGNGAALTATTGSTTSPAPHFHAEPAEMLSPNAQARNTAFSYPGPSIQVRQQSQDSNSTPARGRSLSGLEYADSSKASPASGSKRHKCPYCSTDFTRHHNLKSHLLTHSQEKPYVCHTCQARFRRLHDLKRHAKLHTGERPHTCEKCGRSFARGDALARHNKGPGGCAGRRSSFGGDDDRDGVDGMDGIEYGDDDGDDSMANSQARRVSEPNRKRVQLETPHDQNRSIYRQQSMTYPPVQHRLGEMGPPAAIHANNQATSPRDIAGGHTDPPGSGVYQGFAQHTGGMTESPRPLSPGQAAEPNRLSIDAGSGNPIGRNRSPSLTTQFRQTHFGRGIGSRTPPQPGQFPNSTQLPPLSVTTALNRPPIHSNHSGPGPSTLHHQSVPPHNSMSNPASASSQGQSSGSSMRDILAGGGPGSGGGDADLWAHVRQLEGRFSRMQDEYELRISRLQEEVISLRGQLNTVTGANVQGTYPGESRY